MIFRSFETFVANRFGDDIVDQAWGQKSLSTDGAFTSIGNYPNSDFISLVANVSESTKTPLSELIKGFGESLFYILSTAHSDMVAKFRGPVELLSVIETVIHRDVRKLYSNTELPRFDVLDRQGDSYLHLEYNSTRPFADLAEGLIKGCLDYYEVKHLSSIFREDVKEDGTNSRFEVKIDYHGPKPTTEQN